MMQNPTVRYLSLLLFGGLFIYCGYHAGRLYHEVHNRKSLMEDYAEINKANYELFNVQIWKEEALAIFQKKIKQYRISEPTYQMLDDQIKSYIESLYKRYFESGEITDMILDNLTSSGNINKVFINMIQTQVEEQLKKLNLRGQIPTMSKAVIDQIRQNEPLIREYFQREVFSMMMDDVALTVVDRRMPLFRKYGLEDSASTEAYLIQAVTAADERINDLILQAIFLFGLALLVAIAMNYTWNFESMTAGLTLVSIVLLVLGVTMPMIDIDARLSSFNFYLMNEPISFDEQVIYYQSKSIVEVTKTLWQGGKWDLKLVGVLVIMFSVIFPFFKLIMSGLYLYTPRIRESKAAQLIIFHLGKWSMADVFVVAMFMAYIGFYGIISSQLKAMANAGSGFFIETVNYSRLSPGAFFFTAYTILSIIISILINRHFNARKQKMIISQG